MTQDQNIPGKPAEAREDTSKVTFGDSTLQSADERENKKDNDDYYSVDKPKKDLSTNIGDGEMRNEGTVGMGDIPEDTSLMPGDQSDEQDKAELRDSGN